MDKKYREPKQARPEDQHPAYDSWLRSQIQSEKYQEALNEIERLQKENDHLKVMINDSIPRLIPGARAAF